MLHAVEAHEGVELGEQLVERAGRRVLGGGRRPSRRRPWRPRRWRPRPAAGSPPSPRWRRAACPRNRSMAASSALGGVEVDGGDRERDLDGVRRSSRGRGAEPALASAASSTSNIADGWSAKSRWASTSPESRRAAGVAPASWVSSSGPNAPSTSHSSSSLTRRSIATSPHTRLKASRATSLAKLARPHRRPRRGSPPRGTRVTSSMKRRVGSTSDSLIVSGCGSRHIGQMRRAADGKVTSPTTSKPCRR